jgi:hypothetical protein
MFRDTAIDLQYYAVEHLNIKAYSYGARDERPRFRTAAMAAMFQHYPNIQPLSAKEVLGFIKDNMLDAQASLPKLAYPDIATPRRHS